MKLSRQVKDHVVDCIAAIVLFVGRMDQQLAPVGPLSSGTNPYLTSIYNFWSDILNRQVETIWKAGDEAHLTNGNPVSKVSNSADFYALGLFAYSIMPSIIEAYMSPHPHKDDEGFVWKSS